MGRATRWLRNLLLLGGGGKKDNKAGHPKEKPGAPGMEKDKTRRSMSSNTPPGRGEEPSSLGGAAAAAAALWLGVFDVGVKQKEQDEQSRHAVAVAAVTKVAADAAVAAAHAAEAVVQLTSRGAGTGVGGRMESWAAVRIQTAFRRYLARKALRALRALVKLQALVRGYLVRKQAAATLRRMQALMRAQANVRTRLARASRDKDASRRSQQSEAAYPRRSLEKTSPSAANQPHQRPRIHDERPKIVEIDLGVPAGKARVRKSGRSYSSSSSSIKRPSTSDSSDDLFPPPLPCRFPTRIFVPSCSQLDLQDLDWCLAREDCRRVSATANNTPRALALDIGSCSRRRGDRARSLLSVDEEERPRSAPKQRPEPRKTTRKAPLDEAGTASRSRASTGGDWVRRSCALPHDHVVVTTTKYLDEPCAFVAKVI